MVCILCTYFVYCFKLIIININIIYVREGLSINIIKTCLKMVIIKNISISTACIYTILLKSH